MKKSLTLDEIYKVVEIVFGSNCEITRREFPFGNAEFHLSQNGAVRASWKSKLVNTPILDGKTPRGVSEYYDLQIF